MNKLNAKFGDGCLEILFTTDSIAINGVELNIEIRPRIVVVRGGKGVNMFQLYQHRKKVVYIYHNGKPYMDHQCENNTYTEYTTSSFSLKYTELDIGNYLTLILSAIFLIDYIVISDDIMVFVIPGRRKVFTDLSGNTVSLYIA